jgi:hypothetical protein
MQGNPNTPTKELRLWIELPASANASEIKAAKTGVPYHHSQSWRTANSDCISVYETRDGTIYFVLNELPPPSLRNNDTTTAAELNVQQPLPLPPLQPETLRKYSMPFPMLRFLMTVCPNKADIEALVRKYSPTSIERIKAEAARGQASCQVKGTPTAVVEQTASYTANLAVDTNSTDMAAAIPSRHAELVAAAERTAVQSTATRRMIPPTPFSLHVTVIDNMDDLGRLSPADEADELLKMMQSNAEPIGKHCHANAIMSTMVHQYVDQVSAGESIIHLGFI